MFVNISLKKIFKSKWIYIFIFIMLVILIILLNNKIETVSFGKKSDEHSVMQDRMYNAQYDLTVVSNKNVNTYFVKERYSKDEHTFEYLDSTQKRSYIIIKGDTLTIKNEEQKNVFENKMQKIEECKISYSSLTKAYNYIASNKNNCECSVKIYEKEDVFNVYFTFCGKAQDEFCLNNVLQDNFVSEIQVEIKQKGLLPTVINVLDKNKNVLDCIVYTKFEYEE